MVGKAGEPGVAVRGAKCSPLPASWCTLNEFWSLERDTAHAYRPKASTLSKTSRAIISKAAACPAIASEAPSPFRYECVTESAAGRHSTSYGLSLIGPHGPAIHSRNLPVCVVSHSALYVPSLLSSTRRVSLSSGGSIICSAAVKTSPPLVRWLPWRSFAKMGASDTVPATQRGARTEMVAPQLVGPASATTRNGEPPIVPLLTYTERM